jgi:hypothetical protein
MSATGSVELHARRRGAVRNGQAPARREGRRVDLQVLVDQHGQLRSEGNINASAPSRPFPAPPFPGHHAPSPAPPLEPQAQLDRSLRHASRPGTTLCLKQTRVK